MTPRFPKSLAASAVLVAGVAAAGAAYIAVGGLPGLLYAAGISMAAVFALLRIRAAAATGRVAEDTRTRRWRRKSVVIAELRTELSAARDALDERDEAIVALGARFAQEAETAHEVQMRLEARIRGLEAERDHRQMLLDEERERYARLVEELTGGIGRRGELLAELERELTALVGA